MVSLPREFRARLDSYHGPLDLLLYLIKKEEIDVFDIPIARLIEQYQLYLEVLKDLDPNACGEFLVMAARLMEIKSKLLLPREVLEEDEEEPEDPRIELVRQLLEYKKFKERAVLLERRLETHHRRHRRPDVALPEDTEAEDTPLQLGGVGVWDLLTAFHRIQIALGQRVPHQVVLEDRPPEAYERDIVAHLESREGRVAPFEELFQDVQHRQEAVGYFLAILQLAKEYRLLLEQERPGDTIYIRLRDEEETRRMQELERRESPRNDSASSTNDEELEVAPAEEPAGDAAGDGATGEEPGPEEAHDPEGPEDPEEPEEPEAEDGPERDAPATRPSPSAPSEESSGNGTGGALHAQESRPLRDDRPPESP